MKHQNFLCLVYNNWMRNNPSVRDGSADEVIYELQLDKIEAAETLELNAWANQTLLRRYYRLDVQIAWLQRFINLWHRAETQ